ncbi:hypothetical protein [Streptomyces bacillaris]|uniref:hypothetical protein n=1 Tax=Streptomyces bacillaris TaxID=68179 RepID=UPI0034600A99
MGEPIYDSDLEFSGELLIPRINSVAYQQIYEIEAWFRRICLTAWMGTFGSSWTDEIDSGLRKNLESRMRRNRQRLYFGAESQDDLIWTATQGELLQLLTADAVATSVLSLTGAEPKFLKGKLDEIREIRNILAHNRALTRRAHTILAGLLASLEEAVETFRASTLYGQMDILDEADGWLGSHLAGLLHGNDWFRFQAFVARHGDFIGYTSLPVERGGSWPDAGLLLQAFRDHLDHIVAFCLNKSGDEFTVLAPSGLSQEVQFSLCEKFSENPKVWSSVHFSAQSPKFVCSPKIWFYENRSPFRGNA